MLLTSYNIKLIHTGLHKKENQLSHMTNPKLVDKSDAINTQVFFPPCPAFFTCLSHFLSLLLEGCDCSTHHVHRAISSLQGPTPSLCFYIKPRKYFQKVLSNHTSCAFAKTEIHAHPPNWHRE